MYTQLGKKRGSKGKYTQVREFDSNGRPVAKKFFQIKDITLLGCIKKDLLKRYETDEEMCEACDIVIVMFDSSYWEVFAKDKGLIERWAKKFKISSQA